MKKGFYGEASFIHLFNRYKSQARTRKLEFTLTKEDVKYLTKCVCHYCGDEPKQVAKRPRFGQYTGGLPYIYNGIDRIVNTIGYTVENCVPCCGVCNRMKYEHSAKEFIAACKRVAEWSQ